MQTNEPKKTTLQQTAENINALLLAMSEAQLQKGADANSKELSELAKTLMQAIEISKAISLSDGEDGTLHIVMEREELAL